MAAAPIYIARYRQVTQGDTRPLQRREGEAVAAAAVARPSSVQPDLRAPAA